MRFLLGVLSSNRKLPIIKVLICPHALSDAPHTRGLHLYPDFYEWLVSILKISKQTNYDWYLKLHPDLNQYWDNTEQIVKNLIKKDYGHVKYLDNKTPHSQIISEGINFVVTCAGSVSAEYAYFEIPAINSSLSNPHVDFSFSLNPVGTSREAIFGILEITVRTNWWRLSLPVRITIFFMV